MNKTDADRSARAVGAGARRLLIGMGAAVLVPPLLTLGASALRSHLALIDDVLIYLFAVVCITVVGGFWPAIVAAVVSCLLLNWYLTPPLHTWIIHSPQDVVALALFLAVAAVVGSLVRKAAHRSAVAERLRIETAILLELARTVLAGDDSADAVLAQLRVTAGYSGELLERVGGSWVRVAGNPATTDHVREIAVGANLRLRVSRPQPTGQVGASVLEGYGAQAAAALERGRLRVQVAQAAGLAEADRMRTALLAAVSHDLRTPLASVKASVSTLRQTDVDWSAADRAELLAAIEEGTDRLNALISNLLDMSRIQTGSLRPFLRPVDLDEVTPVMARSLDGGDRLRFDIAEDLPLVLADAGLLERALANLASNALRYSPRGRPPVVQAHALGTRVVIDVIDSGPGVPEDQRARIVQPFQQLGDQRRGSGVGLGLAVAKGFIEAMAGELRALSTLGGGLTMRIELPAAPIPDPLPAAAATATDEVK
ncbi:MAG: sensor histidine kinase [Acidothermaceae bacterium]